MAEVPYQNAAQVEQLLAERENAETYGQATRVEAADKALASFGVTTKAERGAAAKNRQSAAEDSGEDAKKSPPQGRSTAKKSTTAK
jgi:hypothetical protein